MFGNLKIATRMGVAFGVMLVLMLLMAAIATLNQIQGEKDGQTVLAMERDAYQADEWVSQTQLNVTRVLALAQSQAHPAVDAYFSPQIAQTTQRINELQKQLEAVITTPEGKALFSAVGKLRAEYIDARKSFFDTLKAGDHPKADELLKSSVLPKAEAYVAKMREMAKSQHDAVVAEASSRHAAQQVRVYWLNGLGALALVFGGLDCMGHHTLGHFAHQAGRGVCRWHCCRAAGSVHCGGGAGRGGAAVALTGRHAGSAGEDGHSGSPVGSQH